MAILRSARGETYVPCRCLVGRSTLADVQLDSRRASSEHASIGWHSGRWTVRDLGSSNGTTVNGRPLLTRDRVTLTAGSVLRFGGEDETWTLSDASAPEPCAVLLGPQQYLWGQQALLVLPSAEEPEASVFSEGKSWRLDAGSRMTTPECGDIVRLESGYFRLLLPETGTESDALTAEREFDIGRIKLTFIVTAERIVLSMEQDSMQTQLPSRACLHTLLALARERMTQGPGQDSGWVSSLDLAEKRGCSVEKVNVDVHRLRKMFQESGVHQAAQIVERDDGKRLRIGVAQLSETRH